MKIYEIISENNSTYLAEIAVGEILELDGGDAFADVTSTVVSCGDGITPITVIKISNFTGNFVWVRAVATYTAGAINRVLFNH